MKGYKLVSFYIAAHQDDWQLFMTPKAYRDLHDPRTKVVFIYTTAGDAGKDGAYWSAREKGALGLVQFALGTFSSVPAKCTSRQKPFENIQFTMWNTREAIAISCVCPQSAIGRGSSRDMTVRLIATRCNGQVLLLNLAA